MGTSAEIKQRASALAEKTDVNSITPKEVGGIMYDLASHGENVLRNGGTLGIRKVYESVAAMEADSTNPKDFWGDPIKKGNLVVIYDGTTTGVDNNKIYAFMKPGWELATKLDAAYATKAETDAKLAELEYNIRPIIEGFSYKPEVTEIYGEYVSKGSYIGYSDGFARTNQFDVPSHKTIVIAARGYLTNVCMIARYKSDGTYTALVNSIDNNERVYSYTNDTEETIQVVCSFSTSFKRTIRITNIASQEDLNAALYGNQLSQKMSIVANEDDSVLQKGLLSFDMFVEDEYADEAKYLYTVSNIGYYAANNFVGIQGYFTNLTTNAKYQFTFRVDTTNEQPTGIRMYKVKGFAFAKAVGHSGEDIALNYVLSISIDFDIIVGFAKFYSKVKPYKYSSFAKSYATIEEVENNFIGTKQLAYPYEFGEYNAIHDDIVEGLNQGINKSIINNINGNSIEGKALRLEITRTTTSDWSYYWTKDYGVKTKGKYLAFIKIKRNASSPIEFIVFTTGGGVLGRKNISKSLSSEYQMFYIDFELVEDKKVMIGIAFNKAGDNAVIGEVIEVSLLGLAKERTETSLGSDIYTADDYKKYYIQSMNGKMSNIEEIATMAIFQGIPVVGIIGDSLASGVTYNGTGMITDYSKAWWRVLERDSGQKYIPFAKGGLTTRSWLANYLEDALKAENKCCVYIIGLQVNDAYSLGDDYLGTPTDIDTADYNNNADTYYGNYAKIIQALTENNPKCKFFLLTEPRKTGENDSKWNGAIRHIASLFNNCYLVDMQELFNSLYLSGFIADVKSNDAHYPSIGYSYMGKLIEKAIGEVIKSNAKDFMYIQFALD